MSKAEQTWRWRWAGHRPLLWWPRGSRRRTPNCEMGVRRVTEDSESSLSTERGALNACVGARVCWRPWGCRTGGALRRWRGLIVSTGRLAVGRGWLTLGGTDVLACRLRRAVRRGTSCCAGSQRRGGSGSWTHEAFCGRCRGRRSCSPCTAGGSASRRNAVPQDAVETNWPAAHTAVLLSACAGGRMLRAPRGQRRPGGYVGKRGRHTSWHASSVANRCCSWHV